MQGRTEYHAHTYGGDFSYLGPPDPPKLSRSYPELRELP